MVAKVKNVWLGTKSTRFEFLKYRAIKRSSSKATTVARILLSPESSAGRHASNMIAIAKKTHRDRATSLIAMTSTQAKSIQNLFSE